MGAGTTEEEHVETFGGKAYAHTRELEEIIEELEHGNNGATVVKQDNALDPAVTWRMLPMHPKAANLFL